MSLFFFDEIFFLKAVVPDIVALVTEMIQHSFYGAGTAAEAGGSVLDRAEPVFSDQFNDIFQPLFIRSVIHNTSLS